MGRGDGGNDWTGAGGGKESIGPVGNKKQIGWVGTGEGEIEDRWENMKVRCSGRQVEISGGVRTGGD